MEHPKRKHIRLKNYDYSQNGVYFVTICTEERRNILSEILCPVGPDALIGPQVRLSGIGHVVENHLLRTETAYPSVKIEHYVIMPNHIHILMTLGNGPMGASGPTDGMLTGNPRKPSVPQIVRALKGLVTRELGRSVWQTGYYAHIIRDDNDLLIHWQYIDQNPARWAEDEYYAERPAGGTH